MPKSLLVGLSTKGEQDLVRKACEAEVLGYQRRMEDMQVQFTEMLRDTLDKVSTPASLPSTLNANDRGKLMNHAHRPPLLMQMHEKLAKRIDVGGG